MTNAFEVIDREDGKRWDDIVSLSYVYDFYHTSYNHQLDNKFVSKLFYACDGTEFLAMPLVIRPIEGTVFFDATSVYGYCGPISNCADFRFLSQDLISFFQKEVAKYFEKNMIIAAFSRLHPLIDSLLLFDNWGTVDRLNRTVTIDLRLTSEEQRRQYRKSTKSEISQLLRKGFVVEEAILNKDIDAFIDIYYETMDRVSASSNYYFDRTYFYSFLSNSFFGSKLFLAKFQGEIAAGAIFTTSSSIMQYHLAGTRSEYIRDTPMKLLIEEARTLGNSSGFNFLHLGGGVNGKDEDPLFRFKSGFSKYYTQFSVWKYIFNEEEYGALVRKRGIVDNDSNYFPLYRAK